MTSIANTGTALTIDPDVKGSAMPRPTRRLLLLSGALLIALLVGTVVDLRAGVVVGILLVGIILVA